MPELQVIDHPVVQHKLSQLRMKDTPSFTFRQILTELSMLLGYEATRGLELTSKAIETPMEAMDAPVLAGLEPALISVLRAGNGILDGMLEIMPTAPVGHVGVYRDPKTLEAVQYYFKVPKDLPKRDILVLDPMLATGNSAIAALDLIKAEGQPKSLRFVCILAAPEGVANLHAAHPDVPIITACVDRQLNAKGYILPGLGDAGDRIFGTA